MIFVTIGVLLFALGFTSMLFAALLFLLDCLWNIADMLFRAGIILMLIPLICAGVIFAFGVIFGLFGFVILL